MPINCIFCKIAAGEIPADKIYEDKLTLAILDINPSMTGQTVVISKKHASSYFAEVDDKILSQTLVSAKKVTKIIDRALGSRCCLVMEGFDVKHLHYKIFPTTKTEHFRLSPRQPAYPKELKKLAEKIINS